MIQHKTDNERFITKIKRSKIKKHSIPEELTIIINSNRFFTREDIDMDSSSYLDWTGYENKLIRDFLNDNTYTYILGDLLDEDIISDSIYSRRKFVYSRYSKTELLNLKKAEERQRRLAKLLGKNEQG